MNDDAAGRQANGSINRKDLDDLLSSTVLTREVDFSGITPAPGGGGVAGGGPGRVVEAAIRQVLGYRPRAGDTKGFVAALNAVFVGRDAGGYTEFDYTSRPHSAEVQADLGALTGAQASLYTRARAGLDQALPLLDGLYPLRADADPEDCEAIRATVKLKLSELVNEVGVLGGPRPARVDNYFAVLLGAADFDASPTADPVLTQLAARPAAVLKDLQDAFGLSDARVNDISEEENLTKFLILVDTVVTLRANWAAIRGSFRRSGKTSGVFFGTQLVLLSQQLAVVVEAVQETVFAMESVFLGSAERQTVVLDFDVLLKPVPHDLVTAPTHLDPITVGELFDWITGLAADELPQAIDQSGKEGVIALFSTLELVDRYVRAARQLSAQPSTNPTPKVHHRRVTAALANLESVVGEAVKLAERITRNGPKVAEAKLDREKAVTITGSGFADPATAQFTLKHDRTQPAVVNVSGLHPTDRRVLTVEGSDSKDLDGLEKANGATVVVINPDLQRSDPVPVGLQPAQPIDGTPVVDTIDVPSPSDRKSFKIKLTGRNLSNLAGAWLAPQGGPSAISGTPEDSNGAVATFAFNLADTKADHYHLILTDRTGMLIDVPGKGEWIQIQGRVTPPVL
jgi:hypothetical protein